MGIEKGIKKSRNLRLLNFDFGTFLGLVIFLQCRKLCGVSWVGFSLIFSLKDMWRVAGSLEGFRE